MASLNRSTSNHPLILSALVAMTLHSRAWADQILENYSDSLTTYLHASKSNEQDIRSLVDQRGVHIDGALRHGSSLPLMLAGNPFGEGWDSNNRLSDIRLDIGTFAIHDVDLALPAPGFSWVVGRSYNCRQKDSGGSYFSSDGFQGKNWFQLSQPEILLFDGATDDKDVLYLIYGADRFIEFKRHDASSNQFKSKNGAAGIMDFATGAASEPDTYTFTDQHGNKTVFFGFDSDAIPAKGQIWKMTDPAGNVAFVGDSTTASTAITGGYNASGWIINAYDSADRRFTYTYVSSRLTEVKAETKTGGTWASPTGLAEVGKVEYSYYVNADSHGSDGDLKLVKITTPLTDSGVSYFRKKAYWYYEGSYDATTNPGYTNQIQYVIDFEGYRKLDRLDSTDDDDPISATESDMKPYAAAFFKYNTDRQIKAAWAHGACGCAGGSGTGTQEFAYESNGSFSGTSGYDTAWKTRTVVMLPDSSYFTQYFDEVGQPLHRVVSNGDPAVTSGRVYWPTQVTRNSDGQLIQIDSPANITAYTHSSASFTSSSSAGLITVFTRIGSGDMYGFVEDVKHKKGSSGSAYLDGTSAYTSATKTITDVVLTRPLISSRRVYSEEVTSGTTGSYLTSFSYTMHTGDGVLMPKQITTTHPTVTTANNGSNSATTTKAYLRKDGTTAFTESQDSIFNYAAYSGGLLTKSIADAQTNHGSDFASGDDPNGDFGITETANGLRKITTYAYDSQGRSDTVTLPGGMVKKSYYSKLADHRLVGLRYNDYETSPSTKFFGPVSYTVSNHAGKPEAQATVKLTSNESTTALTGHVDETDSDVITAMDLGTVARLSTNVYDKPGNRVDESRMYYSISTPSYDSTTFGYDDSGRRWRVKQADGTIQRTVFDAIGRFSANWIGRNDYLWTGGEGSGPADMVKTSEVVYDSAGVGNNFVTTQTQFIQDTTTDQRQVTFSHDLRGRVLLHTNPNAPHTFNKFDNMGQMIASGQFSSTANIVVGTDDPTTETSNRMTLSQTFFDERGQVWKSQRHKIDDADGSDDDNLQTLNWYDAAGRAIKTDGEQLTKTTYDRLGRVTHQFILASTNDSAYADADDVSGDIVLEEHQTTFDTTDDVVVMQAVIARLHDDYSSGETTGALDTNADSDALLYTAANLEGRIQITANWHDRFDRLIDTVRYGTNGGSNFDRDGLSVPARSDTALRTTHIYNEDGSRKSVTDPKDLTIRFTYDDAGRQTVVINNYVNGTPSSSTGDDDVHTRYAYTNGHKTKMWVDIDGDNVEDSDDQITTWTFGVSKGTSAGDSKFASGSLLYKVVYPEQSGGQAEADKRVLFAYNAQVQEIWKKEHDLNVTETNYDTSGRTTHKRLTTLDASFDNAVLRISSTYDSLGRTQLITQYNNATVGSGSVVDEVKYTFDDWGPISVFEQDRDSAVSGGGNDYEISYIYGKSGAGGENGRNTINRSKIILPSGNDIGFNYNNTGDLHDLCSSRVTNVKDGAVVLAEYRYNGAGQLVGTDLTEPDIMWNQYTTSGNYPDLDRFNRVIQSRWTIDLATDRDFYDIDITYDRNSNITLIEDNVYSSGRDAKFSLDNLNRLTKTEEGDWSGSAITNRSRQQIWTLNQTGNWNKNRLDLNGDNDFIDNVFGGEIDDQRTHNDPNELLDRDLDTDGDTQYDDTHIDLAYNKLGQMTDDGEHYAYQYDGFGRLRQIFLTGTSRVVEEFWYYGNNNRKTWHYDTDVDGDTDSNDKKYHFAYDERWRIVAVFREGDSTPKEEFVHHNAGAGGYGGSSYIDAVILRNKDANTAWTSASDGTLEQRHYYHQNWRADVISISGSGKAQVENVRYFSYGISFGMYAGDVDGDGDVDSTDTGQINTWITAGYDVRGDLDRDGDVDSTDHTTATGNVGTNLGRGQLSAVKNRIGYGGYEGDPVAAYELCHVRYRVLNTDLGRWVSRDSLHYMDGFNLYAYGRGNSVVHTDPSGRLCTSCDFQAFSGLGPLYPKQRPCGRDADNPIGIIPGRWFPKPGIPSSIPPSINPGDGTYDESWCITNLCLVANANRGHAYGRTGCCGGRRIAAICHDTIDRDFTNSSASHIVTMCVINHEVSHLDFLDCWADAPCISEACNECYAYTAEAECLAQHCGDDPFHCIGCAGDPDCEDQMLWHILDTLNNQFENCMGCGYVPQLMLAEK